MEAMQAKAISLNDLALLDVDKSPRNTPTKSYFSLKGIRKIAKRMIKGPSSTKHKINSTSEKKYHQQQQRQYDDDGIV